MKIHPNERFLELLSSAELTALHADATALGPQYVAAYEEQLLRLVLLNRMRQVS